MLTCGQASQLLDESKVSLTRFLYKIKTTSRKALSTSDQEYIQSTIDALQTLANTNPDAKKPHETTKEAKTAENILTSLANDNKRFLEMINYYCDNILLKQKLLQFYHALKMALEAAIDPCIRQDNSALQNQLYAFALSIKKLEDAKGTHDPIVKNLKELLNVLNVESLEKENQDATVAPIIVDHFTDLTNKLAQDPISIKEVQASNESLSKKLEKKPMSRILKSAIYGVIGAVIGSVVGFSLNLTKPPAYLISGTAYGALQGFALGLDLAESPMPFSSFFQSASTLFHLNKAATVEKEKENLTPVCAKA